MESIRYIIYLVLSMGLVIGLTFAARAVYEQHYYASIAFENKDHQFDTLSSEQDAATYFVFKNTGREGLKITNIETSCGCTIPSWNDRLLGQHETDSFKVLYHTENKGYFVKEIMVYSNSITSPDHLTIRRFVPLEQEEIVAGE